ncbi:histidine kinase [Glutamicibacter protophormiae]|uniref:sensor histidine kinase n=1 Tax=Glutamicibacter protophormiae TaxID=37930 RepID=UPI002A7EF918|nr:histidine kinase [Glutamicibacter protophormiae]WPR65093.1 histidine kinase [Glutamicibacter protophormiae]WPR68590.1 histidine kinase [Glutamicibacter protophormiae]
MKVRLKDTLTKQFAGRGVIFWAGIAALLAISATEIITILQDGFSGSPSTAVRGALAGVVLCVALIIGRRWVSASLGIYLASAFFFFGNGTLLLWMVLSAVIFSALAATSESKQVRVWYLTFLIGWMIQFIIRAGDDAILIVLIAPFAALSFVLTRSIFVLRERNYKAVKDMQEADERSRQAIEAERKNIARDLHDIVAHDITVVAMQSKAAKFANDGQMALEAIDVIAKLSTETLHDLRLMLNVLRTDGTMADPAVSATDKPAATTVYAVQGVELFSQRLREANFVVSSHTEEKISDLPRSAQTALYRVMQEATTNVIKHALPGGECSISLTVHGNEARLKITNQIADSTIGKHSLPLGGSGLIGMEDRMKAFGGKFKASEHNGRWILTASIPF